MSFKNLKKTSQTESVADLTKKLDELNKGKTYGDDRQWNVQRDKSGNGYAVIRFLPAPEGEDLAFQTFYTHSFKVNGKWFIENCPTSIGGKCFCCEQNGDAWNSGTESGKKLAQSRARSKRYICNILVISDPLHPENEGKVMLFNFGKKIYAKIDSLMKPPEFTKKKGINPFDFWKGADFEIKVKMVGEFPNYDDSGFTTPSPLLDGDDTKLEALWKQEYKLSEFLDPSKFKSYDEIKTRFLEVTGSKPNTQTVPTNGTSNVEEVEEESAPFKTTSTSKKTATVPASTNDDDDISPADLLKALQEE